MAGNEDATELETQLRALATALRSNASDVVDGPDWRHVILDVRFSDVDRSITGKVRIERTDRTFVPGSLTSESYLHLVKVRNERPFGEARWFGFLMCVEENGECKVTFNYDRNCAIDSSFFDS